MNKLSLPLLFFVLLILPGCGTVEVNKASIPLGLGIDYEENQITVAVQLANPTTPEKSGGDTPRFTVLSSNGGTITEAARRLMLSLPRVPLWSQASLQLLGENLARRDMSLYLDFVTRNPFLRKNIPVVVTHNATPEEILNVKPLIEPYTATAISGLLQTQESQMGIYTPITVMELIERFSTPGIEPVVPMVTIDRSRSREVLKLEGMAIFKGPQMVGLLDETESRGYRYMRADMIQGGLFLIPSPADPGQWVTLELSRSQASITPYFEGGRIVMQVKIKAEGNIYEQSGTGNIFSGDMYQQLNALADQEIEKEIKLCIKKAQDLNADYLGWGRMVETSYPEAFKSLNQPWDQLFPQILSEVQVDFQIRRSYLTDKTFVFRD